MTVRENIRFSAELRNAAGTSVRRLNRITDDVLQVLQLEAQQNRLVGNRITGSGLSGGQRKRVNIGLELAACPTLLFLDEPTSGLDATSSLLLCEMLKKMTHLGMTIVMVIHQPRYSLFTLIDDVLLLGKGGRTAYVGPTNGAKDYLSSLGFEMPPDENPADWMMDILSGHVAVENPRMPSDTLPEALFDEWERAGRPRVQQSSRGRPIQRGREAGDADDREVIRRHVKDEWDRNCSDAGSLDGKGFTTLLENCLGVELTDHEIADELMVRATGRKTAEAITQQEFVKYLLRFRDVNRTGFEHSASDTEESESSESEADEPTPNDLDRVLPGCCQHFNVELRRSLLTQWRQMTIRMCFLLVIVFAALFLGFFDAVVFGSQPWMPPTLLNCHISIALLISVFALTTFGLDRPVYWREASHGLNRHAFMQARMVTGTIDWLVLCFFFTATYYCIVLPELSFQVYIVPFVLVSFVASGWGYLISCVLPPVMAPFCAAVITFMLGGILGIPDKMDRFLDGSYLELVVDVACFTRWSVPMDFLAHVYQRPLNATAMDGRTRYEYHLYFDGYDATHWELPVGVASPWWTGVLALLLMGAALRVATYLALRFMNADKQV